MAPVAKIRARRPIEQTGFFDVPESVQVTVRRSKDVNKRKGNNVPGRSGPKRPKQQTCTKGSSQTCFVSETIGDEEVVASRTSSTTTRYQRESDKQASFQKAAELLPNEHRVQLPLSRNTRNIAFQLQQRAVRGLSSTKPIIQTPPISWSLASWLKFQCPRSGTPLTGACIMEWDSIGVLLAVMTLQDSMLRIYDWDTVSASDVKGRNHRVRRQTNPDKNYPGGSFRIDGTFSINVGIRGVNVRKLIWNPFDPDQIAILDRCVFMSR